jgi:hypothetical protein
MLSAIWFGPLISPWSGVWNLVWESPEAALVLLGAMFSIAMAGLALAMFGQTETQARAEVVPVRVRTARSRRLARRRRR